MSNPLRERLWLYRIRSRKDVDAFAALYDAYVARIYRFVLFKVGTEEDAKEIASDVFMKAWEYILSGKPVTNLVGLLYTMARTGTIDHYRKKKLEMVSLDSIAEMPSSIDIVRQVGVSKELDSVLAAIRQLKDEYREVLLMKHVDSMSTNEIASAIGKTGGNVRVLLHRATGALKEILK
jgi:RNA polymerase sigma-70 factor (ECF subfamily)